MATMKLEIITPEGVEYSDEAELVVVRTIDGDRGVLANHAPFVTGVDIGKVKIKAGEEEHFMAASQGYMEVTPDKVTMLLEAAEFADEIDVERALEAKKRAEERLDKKNKKHIDVQRAEVSLQKALNRLRVAKRDFGEFEVEETIE